MGVPKRLTDKQTKFAEFLVFGGPEGPMTKQKQHLLQVTVLNVPDKRDVELTNPRQSPLVVKYIGQLKEERLKKHEVTYEGQQQN